MSHLRQSMTELMILKGFAKTTQQTYLHQITQLAKYFHRSPEQISEDDLREYMLHCHQDKHWSYSSCRQFVHVARFLFDQVMERPISKKKLPFPKKEFRIPELLSRSEVQRIIKCCLSDKHQTALMLAYGTGMRVSELTALKIADLDGERNVIHIKNAKGNKDRLVDFTEGLKLILRDYWREYTPRNWLFFSPQSKQTPLSNSTLQRAYSRAKLKAEVHKRGGIHSLRHAYATHQLEAGMPLPRLQQMLGHAQISCTLRYTRWVRCANSNEHSAFDLIHSFYEKP